MLPKRVGVPKIIACVSASWSAVATGTLENAAFAAFAPYFSNTSSGFNSANLVQGQLSLRHLFRTFHHRLRHFVDVTVHAVKITWTLLLMLILLCDV
jgi:hypothetical protein